MLCEVHVSIPFKREGLSELPRVDTPSMTNCLFQFPSNGKDFPNANQERMNQINIERAVSIPFKREGLSEPKMRLRLQG